jgi:hypothetical protein
MVAIKTITAHLTPCGIFAKNEMISIKSDASNSAPAKKAWNMKAPVPGAPVSNAA